MEQNFCRFYSFSFVEKLQFYMHTLGDIWIQSCISCLTEGFQPSLFHDLAKTFYDPKNDLISPQPSKDYLLSPWAWMPALLSQLTA